jgi:DNA-binding PadR family transcriptional regulator
MRLTFTVVQVARELLRQPDQRRYGTDLQQALHIRPGTLYPILARFREENLIADHWEDQAEARVAHHSPRRRYYVVTTYGREQLADMVKRWDTTRTATA